MRSPYAVALTGILALWVGAACTSILGQPDVPNPVDAGDDGPLPDGSSGGGSSSGGGDATVDGPASSRDSGGPETSASETGPSDGGAPDADSGPTGSCTQTAISGCEIGTVGYGCTGAARPVEEGDASLACSVAPDAGPGGGPDGGTGYCCTPSTCSVYPGDAGPGCPQGADWTLYTCYGSDVPQQLASGLACEPTATGCGGGAAYCCAPPTCAPSSTSCETGQTGYTCSGQDNPQDTNPTITCAQTSYAAPYNWCCSPITCTVTALGSPGSDALDSGAGAGDDDSGFNCINPIQGSPIVPQAFACPGYDSPLGFTCPFQGNFNGTSLYCCYASPPCLTNADCTSSAPGTLCSNGGGATCIAAQGMVGDPCGAGWPVCGALLDGGVEDGGVACNSATLSCVQSCTDDASCGVNSSGKPNVCLPDGHGGSSCFAPCSSSDDCSAYTSANANTYCMRPLWQLDAGVSICQTTPGQLGDPCTFFTECQGGAGCINNRCTIFDCDAGCGTNSLGLTNHCQEVYDAGTLLFGFCDPGCSSYNDCTAYGGNIPYCGSQQYSCTGGGASGSYCAPQ